MAKEDFCYTHYDGDEARDIAHMNRLERGAYTDIRLAQRKFGRLSLDRIKKILSKDFLETWDSIEAVLKKDDKGNYYIEWLENSINKMRKHSKKQSENVAKRYQTTTSDLPDDDLVLPKSDLETPLENEDGNENRNGSVVEYFGKSENLLRIPLDGRTLEAAEMNQVDFTRNKNTEFIKSQFEIFKRERINDPPIKQRDYVKYPARLYSHFLNWIRNKFPKDVRSKINQQNNSGSKFNSKSAGAERLAGELREELGLDT